MMAVTPPIEAGRVWLPKEAAWLADFQHELLHFPNGKHDDQVDSLSQFLQWAKDGLQSFDPGAIFIAPSLLESINWDY
jgi:phage terminase large subunit-like protein